MKKYKYVEGPFGFLFAFLWIVLGACSEHQGNTKIKGNIMKVNLYKIKELFQKTGNRRILRWVRNQNEKSLKAFKSHPRFEELKDYSLNLMQAKDSILYAFLQGDGFVYNFWRDERYQRGLLRRTKLQNYLNGRKC